MLYTTYYDTESRAPQPRHATKRQTWKRGNVRVRECFMYIPQSQRNQIKPSRRALCTVLYVCRKRVNDGRQNDSEEGRKERTGGAKERASGRSVMMMTRMRIMYLH